MSNIISNNVGREMEYLMRLLNKEWRRTGETKQKQVIDFRDINSINVAISDMIKNNQEKLSENISFEDSLKYTRENYVLLRLVKKIKRAKDKAEVKGEKWFCINLDRDELIIFKELTGGDKGGSRNEDKV